MGDSDVLSHFNGHFLYPWGNPMSLCVWIEKTNGIGASNSQLSDLGGVTSPLHTLPPMSLKWRFVNSFTQRLLVDYFQRAWKGPKGRGRISTVRPGMCLPVAWGTLWALSKQSHRLSPYPPSKGRIIVRRTNPKPWIGSLVYWGLHTATGPPLIWGGMLSPCTKTLPRKETLYF